MIIAPSIVAVLLLAFITNAVAEPMPLPKTGQCPSGFTQSGAYCIDTRRR